MRKLLVVGLLTSIFSISNGLAQKALACLGDHFTIRTKNPNSFVNMRSGPGTNYPIVAVYPNGTGLVGCLAASGGAKKDKYNYTWYRLYPRDGDIGGYIRSDLLQLTDRCGCDS